MSDHTELPGGGRVEMTPRLSESLDSLPSAVLAAMAERGVSYRTAASEMGVAYADLNRFVHGTKDCRLSTLLTIARWVEEGSDA